MTRPGPKLAPLELTAGERAESERWVRRRRGAQDLALRARRVPACDAVGDEGFPVSTKVVAEAVGVSPGGGLEVAQAFPVERLDGLSDEPRNGRPRSIVEIEQCGGGPRPAPGPILRGRQLRVLRAVHQLHYC